MHAHALPLAGAERPALVPDRVRDAEPAEVVDEPGAAQRAHVVVGEPEPRAAPRRRGRRRRARGRGSTATSGRRSSRSPRSAASKRSPASTTRERRLGVDHRVPRADVVEPGEDHVGLGLARSVDSARVELARRAVAREPLAPRRRRRRGARPRRTRRAARSAPASGIASPASSPGQPRPSHRSYAAPSAVEHRRRAARAARRACRAIAAWCAIMPSTSRWPESANSRPSRKRCSGGCPAPRQPHARVAAMRRLRGSWSYLIDFSAMSSPNHFACSCASVWQPTLTSSAV